MIITDGFTLRKILSELRRSEGKNLTDLSHCLPDKYRSMDYHPSYLILSAVWVLIDWGLVEAYKKGKILRTSDMKFERWEPMELDIKLYISKQAIDMEQILGIDLTSYIPNIFIESQIKEKHFPDVFVLMPFNKQFQHIYDNCLKDTFHSSKFRVGRADDFFSNGLIMSNVWSAIRNAKIIIADCTNRNPNVFYEIGIAHSLGKETILISQSIEDIPFDLRHLRVILYKDTTKGISELKNKLLKTISNLN